MILVSVSVLEHEVSLKAGSLFGSDVRSSPLRIVLPPDECFIQWPQATAISTKNFLHSDRVSAYSRCMKMAEVVHLNHFNE